ncbi:UNVERIFIED_CONTAM: hypothetical protein PYX00_007396 [Menopon gallinae]|uniref:SRR1-like domain-containing protein n=1 Tax=Menopon gallinae TaxID=328185 RepID=A0AAW2HIT5_9NEOP
MLFYAREDMHDEFTLVKSKSRRRKHLKNSLPTVYPQLQGDSFDVVKLHRKLNDILVQLREENFTACLANDLKSVLQALDKTGIDHILCYGLGKFSDSAASLHQLALLVHLQELFGSVRVEVFDPVFSQSEGTFLENLNFVVIQNNEEGKHVIDDGKVTLAFLPHCPKQLVNNFLWANWNPRLRNCIIISNSFSKIVESNTKKTLSDSANYILKLFDHCEEILVKDSYDHPNVFNDTSIHYFRKCEELLSESPEMSNNTLKVIRNLLSELRWNHSSNASRKSSLVKYIMAQSRKYQVTDEQLCKAKDEMEFLASTYLCYLKSLRQFQEIHQRYRGKGERSVRETAEMVGFKLPHDAK